MHPETDIKQWDILLSSFRYLSIIFYGHLSNFLSAAATNSFVYIHIPIVIFDRRTSMFNSFLSGK